MRNQIKCNDFVWHHFKKPNKADFDFMQKNFDFHPLDYEDIRTDTPISKIDTYPKYVFCVFHVPFLDPQTKRIGGDDFFVFISKHVLVTNTNTPIPAVDSFFQNLNQDKKLRDEISRKGTAYLLYKILLLVFDGSYPLIEDLSDTVSRLEDSLQSRNVKQVTIDLAAARRNLLYLRHIIDPQRHMLSTLIAIKRPFLPNEINPYFDDVLDTLETMYLTADNLNSIIDGLFEANEAFLSHKTNDIITILTVMSASLMVPTLISGFYGMNVSWLPYHYDPSIVGSLFVISFFGVLISILWIIRRKKL
ncbi:magnesium transporter CorA family protein [Patescibacteria group bacterium]|nr:magnesium transporter CorA family protein [Patescibacteria group bacterium]MBU1705621.1 magnesium transporter CorA family protein [Patescibacteria group bacterium]